LQKPAIFGHLGNANCPFAQRGTHGCPALEAVIDSEARTTWLGDRTSRVRETIANPVPPEQDACRPAAINAAAGNAARSSAPAIREKPDAFAS